MNDSIYYTPSTPLFQNWSLPKQFLDLDSSDEVFLRKIRSCIIRHLSDQNFGVDDLAASAYLSISQLNRRLNLLIGRPAGQLIRELRLSNAAGWLAYTNKPIGEIAGRAGFSDQAHFCRSFKKYFRCTPSRFRKQHCRESREAFFHSINARIWQMDARNVQVMLS